MLEATPDIRREPIASTRACSTASNTARAAEFSGARRRCTAGVVAAEAQRHGVGVAAQHRDVGGGELARRLGQARLVARQRRPVRRVGDLDLGRLAMARRHPATARFRGSAAGSRRSPGLRLEMDMGLPVVVEFEGTVHGCRPSRRGMRSAENRLRGCVSIGCRDARTASSLLGSFRGRELQAPDSREAASMRRALLAIACPARRDLG